MWKSIPDKCLNNLFLIFLPLFVSAVIKANIKLIRFISNPNQKYSNEPKNITVAIQPRMLMNIAIKTAMILSILIYTTLLYMASLYNSKLKLIF